MDAWKERLGFVTPANLPDQLGHVPRRPSPRALQSQDGLGNLPGNAKGNQLDFGRACGNLASLAAHSLSPSREIICFTVELEAEADIGGHWLQPSNIAENAKAAVASTIE
jgi:hypothetical protein